MSRNESPLRAPLQVSIRLAETATPAQLYDWIRALPGFVPGPTSTDNAQMAVRQQMSDALAAALLAREEPLIDLAVASYGDGHTSLIELWRRGDTALRAAIAGNPYRPGWRGFDVEGIRELTQPANEDLLRAVFENPSMSGGALVSLFRRSGAFESIPEDGWMRALAAAARSPTLQHEEDLLESLKKGRFAFTGAGWDDPGIYEARQAAWGLLDRLEPSIPAAALLEALLGALPRLVVTLGPQEGQGQAGSTSRHLKDAREAFVRRNLARWRRENAPGGAPARGPWEPDYHAGVRAVLAAAAAKEGVLDDELRSSEDEAVRRGYYREGKKWTIETVERAIKLDELDFFREAVGNAAFHKDRALGARILSDLKILRNIETERYDDLQSALRVWNDYGLYLWRKEPKTFIHPDRHEDEDIASPNRVGSITQEIELLIQNFTDERNATLDRYVTLAKKAGLDPDEVEAAKASAEAVWSQTGYMMLAVKSLAESLQALQDRIDEQRGKKGWFG